MSASVAWRRRVVSISRPSCDRGRVLTARGEPHAGKRRHHLERGESGPYRVRFTARENRAPDPVACVRRVDEESRGVKHAPPQSQNALRRDLSLGQNFM